MLQRTFTTSLHYVFCFYCFDLETPSVAEDFYVWALPHMRYYFLNRIMMLANKHGRRQSVNFDSGYLNPSLHLVPAGRVTAPLLHEDAVSCVSTVSQHIAKYPLAIPHLSADLLPPPTHTHTHQPIPGRVSVWSHHVHRAQCDLMPGMWPIQRRRWYWRCLSVSLCAKQNF